MRKVLIFILLLLCSFVCNAKQYKLIAKHGVTINRAGSTLNVNDFYNSEVDQLAITWNNERGYYLLKDMVNGSTVVMRPNTIPNNELELKFTEKLKRLLTDVKNCSSRAPEDELCGGLENYMSQTFYLSLQNESLSEIRIASDLVQDEYNYFSVSIIEPTISGELSLPAHDDFILSLENLKEISSLKEGMMLRCCIAYTSKSQGRCTITRTMNLVILP